MTGPREANQSAASATGDSVRRPRDVHVRPAALADVERLAEINVRAWRHAYAGIVPATYLDGFELAAARRRWATRLSDPEDRLCFVADLDGVLAAYAVGGPYRTQHDAVPEDTSGWGELYALYTDPDATGNGAGSAVHDEVLRGLTAAGFRTAALWVLRDNAPAIRWYGGRRWRADGTVSSWDGAGEPLPEVRLTRALAPVVGEWENHRRLV